MIRAVVLFVGGVATGAGGLAGVQALDLGSMGEGAEVTAQVALDRCVKAVAEDNAAAAGLDQLTRTLIAARIQHLHDQRGLTWAEVAAGCDNRNLGSLGRKKERASTE